MAVPAYNPNKKREGDRTLFSTLEAKAGPGNLIIVIEGMKKGETQTHTYRKARVRWADHNMAPTTHNSPEPQ